MAILVGQDGTVENRVVPLPAGLTASTLTQASNYLANVAVGRTLAEARSEVTRQRAARVAELDELTQRLVDTGLATLTEGSQCRRRR